MWRGPLHKADTEAPTSKAVKHIAHNGTRIFTDIFLGTVKLEDNNHSLKFSGKKITRPKFSYQ